MICSLPSLTNTRVAVIGLGYVGLPLALEIAKQKVCQRTQVPLHRTIVAYDIDEQRISALLSGHDYSTGQDLSDLGNNLKFTSLEADLRSCYLFIVCVPTPVDLSKAPDLRALRSASETVGRALSFGPAGVKPVVVFESTVYPGTTQEFCQPIIEQISGYMASKDFYIGYSPERINPGDSQNTLTTITKVTSGCSQVSAQWIDKFYASIISSGTFLAANIMTAEASKIIENTQRDVNIALMNEFTTIFREIGVLTFEAIAAAKSKWNFLPFYPGLVGGHCIGVDPYYLTYKAEQVGIHSQVVLASRRTNDSMPQWYVQQCVLEASKRGKAISKTNICILGFSFKPDCQDIRNTKVANMYSELVDYGATPTVYDPLVDPKLVKDIYGINILPSLADLQFDIVILAVTHKCFKKITSKEWNNLLKADGFIVDLSSLLPPSPHVVHF